MSASTDTGKKRLLLLGGGFEQLIAVRIAKELGADVIVFDGNARSDCTFEATEFRQVNIKNRQELLAAAKEASVDAVFVHAAELAVEAAAVAEHFGLPGISVQTAEKGTDKTIRSECLSAAGVRVPRFAGIADITEQCAWQEAAKHVGYPLIAKPTGLAGARGVEFIEDETALLTYWERASELDAERFQVEEFVEGVQLSTESVSIDGHIECTSIAQRHYDTTSNLWPFQIEDGHSMPSGVSEEIRQKSEVIVEKCRQALGMQNGVLKGDLIIDNAGDIVVLEMAVRTSGGRFCDTVVPVSSGVNILYPLIQLALCEKPDLEYLKPTRSYGVSQRFVLLPEGIKLKQRKHIEHILLQNDVVGHWFRGDLQDLDTAPKIRSHRDRLGYVICTGGTREIADQRAREVVAQLTSAIVQETAA